MPAMQFEFVVGNRPEQLKGGTNSLRSYLSKRSWQAHLSNSNRQQRRGTTSPSTSTSSPSSSSSSSSSSQVKDDTPRRRRRRKPYAVTFELVEEDAQLPMDTQLGGGRVDPFRSYPVPWRPFIPALADHYVVHMAVDIPELDQQDGHGLLRTRWFPLALSEACTFQVLMLLAAANYASVNKVSGMAGRILQLKHEAITAINSAFRACNGGAGGECVSDGLVGAVAKMASFEAMHGDVASYRMHMDGLCRMLAMRGGLDALGLGGLLRRILVWIDLNSAFLLKIERYFPDAGFVPGVKLEPNPARFIAVDDA